MKPSSLKEDLFLLKVPQYFDLDMVGLQAIGRLIGAIQTFFTAGESDKDRQGHYQMIQNIVMFQKGQIS